MPRIRHRISDMRTRTLRPWVDHFALVSVIILPHCLISCNIYQRHQSKLVDLFKEVCGWPWQWSEPELAFLNNRNNSPLSMLLSQITELELKNWTTFNYFALLQSMVTGVFGRNGQLVRRHVKQAVEPGCEIATILHPCSEETTAPALTMSTMCAIRAGDIRSLEDAMRYPAQVCAFLMCRCIDGVSEFRPRFLASGSSVSPPSFASHSLVFVYWGSCLQVMLSSLSVQYSFEYSQIRGLYNFWWKKFTIVMLKKFCHSNLFALWWNILKMCPLVDRLVFEMLLVLFPGLTVSFVFTVLKLRFWKWQKDQMEWAQNL